MPAAPERKLKAWIDALDAVVIERTVEVRLVALGIVSRQNVLLLGPPGTAKSMLASRATDLLGGGTFFQTLLTRFSVPEDVFGPLSLPELELGNYRRVTTGFLPTATIAFIDEVYKANASILNAMLTILNERVFFEGERRTKVPLRCIVAASNETPETDIGLDALDDRLLLRSAVDPLSPSGLKKLLERAPEDPKPKPAPHIDIADLEALDARAATVTVPDEVTSTIVDVREACRKHGLQVSDRRVRQIIDVLRAMAAADGLDRVEPDMLGVMRFALWRETKDQVKASAALRQGLGHTAADELVALGEERTKEFDELLQRLGVYYGARTDPEEPVRKALNVLRQIDERLASASHHPPRITSLWGPLLLSEQGAADRARALSRIRERIASHPVIDKLNDAGQTELAKRWWQSTGRAKTA